MAKNKMSLKPLMLKEVLKTHGDGAVQRDMGANLRECPGAKAETV